MDMSKLFKTLKTLQEDFQCITCRQYYKKKWCNSDEKPCKFCKNFKSEHDTISSILSDIDWQYLTSGEISRKEYYNEFLDNLDKWATHFKIFPSNQDLLTIKELRSVNDWTCNEPDCDYYY